MGVHDSLTGFGKKLARAVLPGLTLPDDAAALVGRPRGLFGAATSVHMRQVIDDTRIDKWGCNTLTRRVLRHTNRSGGACGYTTSILVCMATRRLNGQYRGCVYNTHRGWRWRRVCRLGASADSLRDVCMNHRPHEYVHEQWR